MQKGKNLSTTASKHNFRSFLWHAVFLALASNFMDVDTVIPSMLIKAGGNEIHLGILTAIMLGGAHFMQLVFASFLSGKALKRPFLLLGINLRIVSLFGIAFLFFKAGGLSGGFVIAMIFVLIATFAFSGAFAGVSYIDILGKSILKPQRKRFFTLKQSLNSIGILLSAFAVRELLTVFDYPQNYSILFLFAAVLLAVASLGFWRIREPVSQAPRKKGFVEFLKLIPGEIKQNQNLKFYLLIINSLGLGLSLLPFLIMFAKTNFGLTDKMVGNFLVFRVSGMLVASLLLFRFEKKINYKLILRISIVLGALLPVTSLLLHNSPFAYRFLFFFAGIFVAGYKIALDGILIEISHEENRATYAGIAGAGNILTIVFPLVAGVLIAAIGYTAVFVTLGMLVLSSFFFTLKLDCSPEKLPPENF